MSRASRLKAVQKRKGKKPSGRSPKSPSRAEADALRMARKIADDARAQGMEVHIDHGKLPPIHRKT